MGQGPHSVPPKPPPSFSFRDDSMNSPRSSLSGKVQLGGAYLLHFMLNPAGWVPQPLSESDASVMGLGPRDRLLQKHTRKSKLMTYKDMEEAANRYYYQAIDRHAKVMKVTAEGEARLCVG